MKPTVLVVGDTLAGLTAAFRLARQGYAVTLIAHDGGHRPSPSTGPPSDHPLPPVLTGCHTATRSLLATLGTAHHARFSDRIRFELLTAHRRLVPLRRPLLPAPLHIMASLALFSGMPARDRWRFLLWIERTWERDPALPVDLESHTAEAWLRGIGQSDFSRDHVWTPLVRFLLGDDIKTVSAAALLNVLMRCFLGSRRDSQLAIPVVSIEELLYQPMRDALSRLGVSQVRARVERIHFDVRRATSVEIAGGDTLKADSYVSAMPHHELTPLLPERLLSRFSYFQQISALVDTAAVTVHAQFDVPIARPRLVLMAGRTFHSMHLKPSPDGSHTSVSFVMTGQDEPLHRPDKELMDLADADLQYVMPGLRSAPRLGQRISRAPHALLSVRPGSAVQRPLQRSPITNLVLAGAWTDTSLPSTVESSIVSGDRSAQAIIEQTGR